MRGGKLHSRLWQWGAAACGLILMVLTLHGCYLPDQFRSEIRLSKDGAFALSYYGDLIYAPLYSDIIKDKLTPGEIPEKTDVVKRDLGRDGNFKKIVDKGRARFAVEYERKGWLELTQLVTFVRRNSKILSIKGAEDGSVVIRAATLPVIDAQNMANLGVSMKGEFRVVTDAEVSEHNANEVRPFGLYRVYIWRIENTLSPSPKLTLQRAS